MRFLSVCSGIEAASVAWSGLGWECVGFAEIEPFPCEVLKQRFPGVRNFGDIRTITREAYPDLSFSLLVGGTPCQSFSIAGKRDGLRGLSGLAMEYVRILEEFRPRWFLWENVPGCVSVNSGQDFRTFLSAIAEIGIYECAWRVLDAQYFGVPQRRRRVFVVGCSGGGCSPEEVLFESPRLSGHPEKDKEAWKEAPDGAWECAEKTGGEGGGITDSLAEDSTSGTGLQPHSGRETTTAVLISSSASGEAERERERVEELRNCCQRWPARIASTLDAHFGDKQGLENQHVNAGCPLFVPGRPDA